MPLDYETIVAINLAMQIVVTAALSYALILARKREFKRHCSVMRLAGTGQILAIAALMSPAMGDLLEPGAGSDLFAAEVYAHHALGLAAMLLWIYINLPDIRHLKARLSQKSAMRAAAGLWAASIAIGFHIYFWLNY
ncbi:MAG: hypothetical protein ACP5OU_06795 [Methanothrix sp.]